MDMCLFYFRWNCVWGYSEKHRSVLCSHVSWLLCIHVSLKYMYVLHRIGFYMLCVSHMKMLRHIYFTSIFIRPPRRKTQIYLSKGSIDGNCCYIKTKVVSQSQPKTPASISTQNNKIYACFTEQNLLKLI